jgi:hypothetical protein
MLLFGTEQASPAATVVARLAGGALLAIGAGCWLARGESPGPARLPLIAGALVYDAAAAVVLAHTGLTSATVGLALWPAVVFHAVMTAWCVACLWNEPVGK